MSALNHEVGIEEPGGGAQQGVALVAQGVWRSFGNRWALREVNLKVPQGERLVVLGPNGSGKTTLIKVLSTLLRPDSGRVSVLGMDARDHAAQVRQRIGVVSHRTYLYDDLTARENLALFGQLYRVLGCRGRVEELLSLLRMEDLGDSLVRNLSRGMQQRLAMARALLHRPQILLLDEPDTGLDPEAIDLLEKILLSSSTAERRSAIITTHDLELARRLADRVAILNQGCIVHEGPVPHRTEAELRLLYQEAIGQPLLSVPRSPGESGQSAAGDSRTFAPSDGASLLGSAAQGLAILRKDLLLEVRTREALVATATFALLALLVFNFAFVPSPETAPAWGAGALWASILFAGMLGFGRAFTTERDRGTLDGLRLAPVDRGALYGAKLAANCSLMFATEAVALPAFGAMYNLPVFRVEALAVVFLGTFGLATVGTLFGAMTASVRARDLLLPVLLLPLAAPAMIGAVSATAEALGGQMGAYVFPWTGLLLAFGAIFLAASLVLFEHVVED